MDETYIKIKGEWWYYYRAVDKSGANALALHHINTLLWFSGVLMLNLIDIVDIKYLNNIVEQSHRPIKEEMVQALGWKSEAGALATMAG